MVKQTSDNRVRRSRSLRFRFKKLFVPLLRIWNWTINYTGKLAHIVKLIPVYLLMSLLGSPLLMWMYFLGSPPPLCYLYYIIFVSYPFVLFVIVAYLKGRVGERKWVSYICKASVNHCRCNWADENDKWLLNVILSSCLENLSPFNASFSCKLITFHYCLQT